MSTLQSVGQHFMLGLRPTPTRIPKIKSCFETCVPPALCCSRAISPPIVLTATGLAGTAR
jgi:hypothetical protein